MCGGVSSVFAQTERTRTHAARSRPLAPSQFRTYKIIYRRYAGLYFTFCVDVTDNELAYLEGIHLFVEMLDHYFGNVCELDLVFNFHKVRPAWHHMRTVHAM